MDNNIEIILEISYYTFSNADISFLKKEIAQKNYTTCKVLRTIKKIELIDKKEFAKAALDKNFKAFVVHIEAPSKLAEIAIYFFNVAQVALLQADKVSIEISLEYTDYQDSFCSIL